MAPDPGGLWCRAVVAGAQGRYAEADALLQSLPDDDSRWVSLSLSTRASHLRQVGSAQAARQCDAAALRVAGDAEARADALIGLAADAVALGDVDGAVQQHAHAETDAGLAWRTRTRWHWVGAELAMLMRDDTSARGHAVAATMAARRQSPRHEAKSQLILAAATGDVAAFPEISHQIEEGGWITLAWPLALIAGDHAEDCDPTELARMWSAGREATYAIEAAMPPGLVEAWVAHPGVHRLRADGPPPGGG